jgi:hypothetical protein
MKKAKIIVEIEFEEENNYSTQALVNSINLEYLNQALDIQGIENLEVSAEIIKENTTKKYAVAFEERTMFVYEVTAADEEKAEELGTKLYAARKDIGTLKPVEKFVTDMGFYNIEEINN